jgi:outer membrane protein assembly factor BamB
MSQQMTLERMLADLMADEGSGHAPDQLIDNIVSTTSRARPLPRWLAVLREPTMTTRARVAVGVPTRQLALIGALLILGALVAIGAAAALLLRPQAVTETWPGFRGDGTRAGIAITGPVGNPVVRWQFHAEGAIASDIAVEGDLVLVPSDAGTLHALDFATGTQRWSFTGPAPMHGPYVTDGRVYVADGAGVVHALGLADGKELWKATESLVMPSDLVVFGDRVFVGSGDGAVLAMNIRDGTVAWRVQLGSTAIHSPAVTANALAISTDGLELAVLDPATGTIRWRVPSGVSRSGTPVIVGEAIYLGSASDTVDGRLTAHDLATGTERWRIDQNIYSPSLAGSIGYTGSAGGRVTAVDLATGVERWVTQFDGPVRAPAVAGKVVYLAADREQLVVALDAATGGELWSSPLDGGVACCIAAVRGTVFVGTSAGTVYAIGGDGATLTPKARPNAASTPSTAPSRPAASASPQPSFLPTSVAWTATTAEPDYSAWGLAQAPDGKLWVSIARENRFDIYTPKGAFLESWGTGGKGNGQFDLRRANGDEYGMVAFAPDGSFFVLDPGNRRIQAFDAKRRFLRAWGGFGNAVGTFNDPVSIAVDAAGNVGVLDDERGVIEVYTPAGKVVRTIPAFPASIGRNDGANQLQVGPNGHYYVSIVQPNVVAELDAGGALVRTYGDGTRGFSFNEQPNRVGFDSSGRVYVTQGSQRGDQAGVVIFAADGTYLGGIAGLGSGEAELRFAWGLIVTDDGLYVTDAMSPEHALQKFEPIAFP